ncbi:MAG: TonB-dependent receptor [Phenylobacterium sp.]|nr:TonB-dependent receptor [Phenylobacterium sp.]
MPSHLTAGVAAIAFATLAVASPVAAQNAPLTAEARAARRADLEQQKAAIQAELDRLDMAPASASPSPAPASTGVSHSPGSPVVAQVVVTSRASPIAERPLGQTVVTVSRDLFKDTAAFSVGDILKLAPGVSFIQGNGPRDVSVSIRGSNERQTFAIRNIQMFEDGFPVTQPDGTARSDLTDPHAYAGVDVIEGPSSALYGNYATGGAINFRTRFGGDINGLEAGADFGSYGYFNDYATLGGKGERYEYSAFVSNVRGDGATGHTGFNTTTENILATYAFTPHDRVTLKFINNDLDADLSLRLSRNQYQQNPYQLGCATPATLGCATVSLFTNGFNGARTSLTADQAGLGRHDRRTIIGARYEHDIDDQTVWRTTATFDNRDIRQPTSSTDARGTFPSFNVISDVTRRSDLFGHTSTVLVGGFFNYQNINSATFNLLPVAGAQDGGLTQTVNGHQLNAGLRGRAEIALTPSLTGVVGLGLEYTELQALQVNLGYPTTGSPTLTSISAERTFFNVAPEASLVWQPQAALALHARISTGYGTPQATNLFVTPQGTFGNNTQLQAQKNTGLDVGVEWAPSPDLRLMTSAFYEWFDNELVTQSAGVNLQSYTFNAPHSEHRGVELSTHWRPLPAALPGARLYASYLYDNQVYTTYVERLTAGAVSATFDRSGNRIPGVAPSFGTVRLSYDQPSGALRGLGGFVEGTGRDAYMLDNANLIAAPGFVIMNAGLHWDPPAELGLVAGARFFVEVRNLLDQRYVGSANNISDTLNAATGAQNGAGVLVNATGSIYAGAPRSVFGGVRVKF